MGTVLEFLLEVVSKVLPLFLAFKSGEDKVQKKVLEDAVKEGEMRNAVEAETSTMDRPALVARLRQLINK